MIFIYLTILLPVLVNPYSEQYKYMASVDKKNCAFTMGQLQRNLKHLHHRRCNGSSRYQDNYPSYHHQRTITIIVIIITIITIITVVAAPIRKDEQTARGRMSPLK